MPSGGVKSRDTPPPSPDGETMAERSEAASASGTVSSRLTVFRPFCFASDSASSLTALLPACCGETTTIVHFAPALWMR